MIASFLSARTKLQTKGVNNAVQRLLNLVEGTNVTLTDNGDGSVTIAATGGGGAGALTQISQQILVAPAASVTFSAIPNTFTNLLLVISAVSATQNDGISMQANGDTGANYAHTLLNTNPGGSVAGGTASTANPLMGVPAWSGATGGSFGDSQLQISNYAKTTNSKCGVGLTVTNQGNGSFLGSIYQTGWFWKNTAAINALKLYLTLGGNFTAGDTFTLYGMQ